MIEHLFDEALLVALREGRHALNFDDVMEAKLTEEIGSKQPTAYTDTDRAAVATHEAGHATIAYVARQGPAAGDALDHQAPGVARAAGAQRRGGAPHPDEVGARDRDRDLARRARRRGDAASGESGTGPGADLAHATALAAQMVGSFGMAGSLISYEAVADGPLARSNLVGKVLANTETKQKVEDILEAQRVRVREVLRANRDVHAALARRAARTRRARPRRDPRRDRAAIADRPR